MTIPDTIFSVPEAVRNHHRNTTNSFARSGTWLTGEIRRNLVIETRNAPSCGLCSRKKEALSPASVRGEHDLLGDLPPSLIELVHKLQNDSGRITSSWVREILDMGMTDEEYVEASGTISTSIVIDTYAYGLGLALEEIPPAEDQSPSMDRLRKVTEDGAFFPITDTGPEESGGGGLNRTPNIVRAMGLVPSAVEEFFGVMAHHYGLPGGSFRENTTLQRPQVELIAAKVSAINECFY